MRCIKLLIKSSFTYRRRLKSSRSGLKPVCWNMLISACLRTTRRARSLNTKRYWTKQKTWFQVLGRCCKRRLTLWTGKMRWRQHVKLSSWARCLDCLGIRELSLSGMSNSQGTFWKRVISEWWRLRNEFWSLLPKTNVLILKKAWSCCSLDLQG